MTEADTLHREISASREEFARNLRAAFPAAEATTHGWQLHWHTASAEIELTPMPDLVIALLRLPRHHCLIRVRGHNIADRQALLDRLDRYQQRGGG